ncbi:MAG TPA: FKBP-type peptidyl-prolyl cis-trans isomerase [Cytophagaceae bacterium]|jgi:FKBP-type peptidyl-prolyl cis-trans isomerase FkpA|nr:FKBP-type peptidyl-prolyl cis-trans isomerase [Cytophagaceae bacterium]
MNQIKFFFLAIPMFCLGLSGMAQTTTKKAPAATTTATKSATVAPAPKKDYKKSPNGLLYKFFVNKEGVNAKSGDVLRLNFALKTEKDSLLRSTFKEGNPAELPLRSSPYKGSLEEGLMMMSVGDSASFLVNADSLFAKVFFTPLPPFIRKGSNVEFVIKMIHIMTEEEYKKEKEKTTAEMVAKEDQTIQEYLTKNNLKGTKTASGLYYVQTAAGNGVKAEKGKTVSVHYTGKLLNGTKFDSSVDRGQPFEFGLGAGQVIQGWDEGIALMSVGEKGILLVPSVLGYGARGAGGAIPPNSVLIFDVELLGVK